MISVSVLPVLSRFFCSAAGPRAPFPALSVHVYGGRIAASTPIQANQNNTCRSAATRRVMFDCCWSRISLHRCVRRARLHKRRRVCISCWRISGFSSKAPIPGHMTAFSARNQIRCPDSTVKIIHCTLKFLRKGGIALQNPGFCWGLSCFLEAKTG